MLIEAGFSCGAAGADGIFGEDTEAALIDFQYGYGLKEDGLYGKESRAKLESVKKPAAKYIVQAGAFNDLDNAKELAGKLQAAGFDAIVKTVYKEKAASRRPFRYVWFIRFSLLL